MVKYLKLFEKNVINFKKIIEKILEKVILF